MKKIAFAITTLIILFSVTAVQAKTEKRTAISNCQVVTTYSAPKAPGTMKAGWLTEAQAKQEKERRLNGRTEMEALDKGESFAVECKH